MRRDYYTNERDYRPNESAFDGTDYRFQNMNRDRGDAQRMDESFGRNRRDGEYGDYDTPQFDQRQASPRSQSSRPSSYSSDRGSDEFYSSDSERAYANWNNRRDPSRQGRQEFQNFGRSDQYHPGYLPANQYGEGARFGGETDNRSPFSSYSQFGGNQTRGERSFDTTADRMYSNYGQHGGKGPKNYRRSRERIEEEVSEALMWNEDVDASEIEVQADDQGEITLTGHVDSRRQKRLAEDLAEAVRGVRDVHNQLRVGSSDDISGERESKASDRSSSKPAKRTGREKRSTRAH